MRLFILSCFLCAAVSLSAQRYIKVSDKNPNYFSFADGSCYIPIGINMINPSGGNDHPEDAFREIEEWMKNLSANGGNYIRVWLSQSFWDIEQQAGKYDEQHAKRIDSFISMARKYHLRIKLTLEHFRSITLEENPQNWATKFVYHTSQGGPLHSISEYIATEKGRKLFLDKLDFYKTRYGSDTLFFGWELWNEMNAMAGPEDSLFFEWNETMLDALKKTFPENLAMQSLGSFDGEYVRSVYKKMMNLSGNDVAQVHRYLDPGAKMPVCHGPMDLICSSAINDIRSFHPGKPVILAETGAVEPNHAGPSKLYPKDTAGILLHDILFAPFFSGAAGPGMSWHWESYVHRNNLWYHFSRFREAIKNVNPIDEAFTPSRSETEQVRIYTLQGKNTTLIWCRDKENNWQTELEQNEPAQTLQSVVVPVKNLPKGKNIKIYDPWKNTWTEMKSQKNAVRLPAFRRSAVLKIENRE